LAPEVGLEPTTKRSEAQSEGGAGQAAGRVVRSQPAGRLQGTYCGGGGLTGLSGGYSVLVWAGV